LGRAVPANSGYRGAWVQADAVLDNAYFRDLVDRPWGRETNDFRDIGINRTTHQWNDINRMMLTTDMVLAYDLGDEPNTVSSAARCFHYTT
jgi:catalase (peroxidase I)